MPAKTEHLWTLRGTFTGCQCLPPPPSFVWTVLNAARDSPGWEAINIRLFTSGHVDSCPGLCLLEALAAGPVNRVHRRMVALPCLYSSYPIWTPRHMVPPRPSSMNRSSLPLRGTEDMLRRRRIHTAGRRAASLL
ncbi:hypothetical protein Q8A73_011129 [Channa argus]|nr:hypothetical protein Q8A73_011129 [Channa argus]